MPNTSMSRSVDSRPSNRSRTNPPTTSARPPCARMSAASSVARSTRTDISACYFHVLTHRRRPRRLTAVIIGAIALGLAAWLPLVCPMFQMFISAEQRALIELKNRTSVPNAADFDRRATLEALLEPGSDRERWSAARAARVEGYVVAVQIAGLELANCFSLSRRDIHLDVGLTPNA